MNNRDQSRPSIETLSRSAELSNRKNTQGALKLLFSQKARLAAQTKSQVTPLFNQKQFYGRGISRHR